MIYYLNFHVGAQERYNQELIALQNKSKQATETENIEDKITELEIKDSSTEQLNATDGVSNSNSSNEKDDINDKLQCILNEEFNELSKRIQSLQTEDLQVNGDIESEDNTLETKDHKDRINVEIQSVKDRIAMALSPLMSAESK